MFFGGYAILVLAGLALTRAWDVVDGPAKANSLPESKVSAYEHFLIRQKIQNVLDVLEKHGDELLMDPTSFEQPSQDRPSMQQQQRPFNKNQRSAISKGQLNRIVKAMRTRMFGSI